MSGSRWYYRLSEEWGGSFQCVSDSIAQLRHLLYIHRRYTSGTEEMWIISIGYIEVFFFLLNNNPNLNVFEIKSGNRITTSNHKQIKVWELCGS